MALRRRVHSPSSLLRRVSRPEPSTSGRDARARRSVGRREDDDTPRRRGPPAAGSRDASRSTTPCCSTPTRRIDVPPEQRRGRLPLPGVRALPASRRAAERALRRPDRLGWTSCSSGSASASSPRARSGELSGGERQRVALARALARGSGRAASRRAALGARRPHAGRQSAPSCTRCSFELGSRPCSSPTTSRTPPTLADRVDGRRGREGAPARDADELVGNPVDPFVASLHRERPARGRHAWPPGRPDRGRARRRGCRLLGGAGRGQGRRRRLSLGGHAGPHGVRRLGPQPIRAPVTSIVPDGDRVACPDRTAYAEITAAAARELELVPGAMVIASFKATAARLVPLA